MRTNSAKIIVLLIAWLACGAAYLLSGEQLYLAVAGGLTLVAAATS